MQHIGLAWVLVSSPPFLFCLSPARLWAPQVKYVFKNLMRDWSVEGAGERSQSYGRMLTELRARLPLRRDTAGGVTSGPEPPAAGGEAAAPPAGADGASPPPPPQQQLQQGLFDGWPRVLVPGAGLGRLCLEVAAEV